MKLNTADRLGQGRGYRKLRVRGMGEILRKLPIFPSYISIFEIIVCSVDTNFQTKPHPQADPLAEHYRSSNVSPTESESRYENHQLDRGS
jgi:hypothetical protein